MAIQHLDSNFLKLKEAYRISRQVKFAYRAQNGKLCVRNGFVAELTDKHVRILDTLADGPRLCPFQGIISEIEYSHPDPPKVRVPR